MGVHHSEHKADCRRPIFDAPQAGEFFLHNVLKKRREAAAKVDAGRLIAAGEAAVQLDSHKTKQ